MATEKARKKARQHGDKKPVYIDPGIHHSLKDWAAAEGRSMTWLVCKAIEAALQARQEQEQVPAPTPDPQLVATS